MEHLSAALYICAVIDDKRYTKHAILNSLNHLK